MTVLVVGFVGGSLPFCCGFALLGPGLLAVGWWLRSSFSSVFVSGVFPPLLVRTPPRFASVLAVSGFVLALISRDLRLSLVLVVWFSLFLFFFPRRYLRFFPAERQLAFYGSFQLGFKGSENNQCFVGESGSARGYQTL